MICYTIPMLEDSRLRGGEAGEVAVGSPVLPTVKFGRIWWATADSNHARLTGGNATLIWPLTFFKRAQ